MNRANPLPPASKAANSKIERKRSVNVSGASGKNKGAVKGAAANRAAVSRAAVSRAAVSKADDKTGSFEPTSGGR